MAFSPFFDLSEKSILFLDFRIFSGFFDLKVFLLGKNRNNVKSFNSNSTR